MFWQSICAMSLHQVFCLRAFKALMTSHAVCCPQTTHEAVGQGTCRQSTVPSWQSTGLLQPSDVLKRSSSLNLGYMARCRYPAELRAEVYYPWYFQRQRPVIRSVANNDNPHAYGSTLTISVQVAGLNQRESPPYRPVSVESNLKTACKVAKLRLMP